MVMKQEEVLMQKGYDVGIGVAMSTGSPLALGATGEVTEPQFGAGGSGSFTFRRLENNEELETALGISADVSAGIGLFRGSASFDFSKECKIQTSSLCVMVAAKEEFAFKQMDSPELSKAASDLVEQGKLEQFTQMFGEYFVRGISTGGRFIGVIRIETNSTQSKMDVDAALSASYGLQVDADVRVKIAETLKTANARIDARYIFDGGEVKTRVTSSDPLKAIEQLYQAMDEWTDTVQQKPKAYSVTLAPYFIALGPTPPNIVEIENQRDVLIRCAKLRSQTMDKLNLIDYILDPDHIGEFEFVPPPPDGDGPDLPALQAKLAGDLNVIAETASFAINNLKEACQPEVFMQQKKGIQDFKFTALPVNLPKHTGGAQVLPSLRVPDFVSAGVNNLTELFTCLSHQGTVEDCIAGTAFGGGIDGIPDPIPVNREVAEFLNLFMFKMQWIPGRPDELHLSHPDSFFGIVAQSPPPGSFVNDAAEVSVQFIEVPPP